MLKTTIAVAVASMLLGLSTATAADKFDEGNAMKEIHALQDKGELTAADKAATEALKNPSLTSEQRRSLEYELERSRRIRGDYRTTRDSLTKSIKSKIKDATDAEIDEWAKNGRLDSKKIDGEERFVSPSVSNLFFRYPELRARRTTPKDSKLDRFIYDSAMASMEAAEKAGTILDPAENTQTLTMTITVDANRVPEGETIKCWMPFPQEFAAQYGVQILETSPDVKWINAPRYPHRSLYFEQPSQGAKPTVFTATYRMTARARYIHIDPDRVASVSQTDTAEYKYFTSEQPPHVVFDSRIRELAAEIVGTETNPAIKARLIYDYVAHNFVYSYAREYSTLTNIPEYVLTCGYGDCGQIALLYITLCRASGIPARWQSGWVVYPSFQNLHDWTEIYLAPYGWVPVDPDFSMEIVSQYDTFSAEEKDKLRDFYFGGLDKWRLIVNSEHAYPHYPAKEDFRSDNVDFQRGELEAGGKNIYFPDFSYDLTIEEKDEGERTALAK